MTGPENAQGPRREVLCRSLYSVDLEGDLAAAGLTAAQRERYWALREAGESHHIALMLAQRKAPDGRVKGSAHPTRDWHR